ncbi:MAG: hypothetical protein RL148_102 [Planctomycetota bacterium]|jgi:nicotinate-nucleotide pyrophosphorylase (carboxylating)
MHATPREVADCVRRALAEDLGAEPVHADLDLTSRISVPAGMQAGARIVAKARGVVAGTRVAEAAFRALDPAARIDVRMGDGSRVQPGDLVMVVHCGARALLAAERTALNFLQRLSGVATATRAMVDAVAGTGALVLDTRKTTPGLRMLEKDAVVAGGGTNHRIGLFDQVLLKENHFAMAGRPYEQVVRDCVAGQAVPVVAEARTVDEALAAVRGGAAVVLMDNFAAGRELRDAIQRVRAEATASGRKVLVEASGGIRAENVRSYAECGVDRISVGALTHSAPALDLSLLVEGA